MKELILGKIWEILFAFDNPILEGGYGSMKHHAKNLRRGAACETAGHS